jgi:threonine/homoserine/homoserine lactone efflux protein
MNTMLGIHDLWLFIVSAVLVNISPGPDSAYIVGRSLQLGWRAGMMAALGISCGCLVHVFGTAIGLSALLMASSLAFTVIKWVGAAYLCYIGLTMLLSRQKSPDGPAEASTTAPRPMLSLRQVFWQGVLTDVLRAAHPTDTLDICTGSVGSRPTPSRPCAPVAGSPTGARHGSLV